jgi:hypothetical protein
MRPAQIMQAVMATFEAQRHQRMYVLGPLSRYPENAHTEPHPTHQSLPP